MKNQQIAKIFSEIADLLELKGENVFRIRAYRRAAQNIDGLSKDVAVLSEQELTAIPGIGKDLAGKIHEYLSTRKIAKYEELKREISGGVVELLRVPGLGPKTAKQLHEKLKIKDIDQLEELAKRGKLSGLPGIQKKTEENILKGIELLKRGTERRPLGRVLPLAEDIVRRVKEEAPVEFGFPAEEPYPGALGGEAPGPGAAHQRKMARVQRAHGWHQPEGAGKRGSRRHPRRQSQALFPIRLLARPQSDRTGDRQVEGTPAQTGAALTAKIDSGTPRWVAAVHTCRVRSLPTSRRLWST